MDGHFCMHKPLHTMQVQYHTVKIVIIQFLFVKNLL